MKYYQEDSDELVGKREPLQKVYATPDYTQRRGRSKNSSSPSRSPGLNNARKWSKSKSRSKSKSAGKRKKAKYMQSLNFENEDNYGANNYAG